MFVPRGATPIVYHDDVDMQNENNGGECSRQIIPRVVQIDHMEESGMLVPQVALQAIPL